MSKVNEKRRKQLRRAHRVRAKIKGTAKRPRLSVFRSLKHINAQLIDDDSAKTLVSASDLELKSKEKGIVVAQAVGKLLAEKAAKKKITSVVFDRGPFAYHGQVEALAESARKAGLKF